MVANGSHRQSRSRQPKSYRVTDEYAFLDNDEDGSAPSGRQTPATREEFDDEDADDFLPDAEEPEPEDDFDEDIIEEEDEDEDGDDDIPEREILDIRDVSIVASDDDLPSTPTGRRPKKIAPSLKNKLPQVQGDGLNEKAHAAVNVFKNAGNVGRPPAPDKGVVHARGIADFSKIGGQELRLRDLFGPTREDLIPILKTRDHWHVQETLPIGEPGAEGCPRRSFFEKEESREEDTRVLRKWYADDGQRAFRGGQKHRVLKAGEAGTYMATDGPESLNVLLGSVKDPKLHALTKGTFVDLAQPFQDGQSRGWLFNLGSRVVDAQWASNEEGIIQHLAVTVAQKEKNGRQPKPYENPKAPAFSATKPYPASIQIWSFQANEKGGLDSSAKPQLELVICTDWGAPKQLRWCPVGVADDTAHYEDGDEVHVGLLAGIWSDGRVKVLDITYLSSSLNSPKTNYVHYSRAAFDVDLPHTVPSCIHWLSGTTLAVATAAGTLAIWTLHRAGTFPKSPTSTHVPKPWFYRQIADTYILTLASGRPSRPNYISITTADGFARLYDLRSPSADSVPSIRGRMLCTAQAWHEQTQSFAMSDELIMLKHNSLRRFYHNLYTIRCESSITCVATSAVHPGVLVGSAHGVVTAGNPLSRILNYKEMPWQQDWFAHEWRGPVDRLILEPPREKEKEGVDQEQQTLDSSDTQQDAPESAANDTARNAPPPEVLSEPLVRIMAGYKVTQPGMQESLTSKKPADFEWGRFITIYEEKSAITTVAWNPNLKFGTWAVAGMGSGLLRVEDVGV